MIILNSLLQDIEFKKFQLQKEKNMTAVVLDAGEEAVEIVSGLSVTDPYGTGVIIASDGGGGMDIKALAGGTWQGSLMVYDRIGGKLLLSLSPLGVGLYDHPEVLQQERVGQLAATASNSDIITKYNALELVIHNLGATK